jgi:hypothetical protein
MSAGVGAGGSNNIPRLFFVLTVAVVVSLSTLRNSMGMSYSAYVPQQQQPRQSQDLPPLPSTTSSSSSLSSSEFINVVQPSEEPNNDDNSTTITILPSQSFSPVKICFITSVYAKWVSNADKVMNVTKWKEKHFLNSNNDKITLVNESSFEFLVYTNLPVLKTPGWTKIVQPIANVTRYATQSRWPKFLAWQDERISSGRRQHRSDSDGALSLSPSSSSYQCQVIFYLDAIGNLIGTPQDFQDQAREILLTASTTTTATTGNHNAVGWAQYPHRGGGGISKEFRRIQVVQKDTVENIQASLSWLHNQSDFRDNCTLYENRFLAYDVTSSRFQQASKFFWHRYSLEQDSWRDQPLWCYVLDHFQVVPLLLRHKVLFGMDVKRMAKKKHKQQTTT